MRKVLLLLGSLVLLAAGLDSVLADCQRDLPLEPAIRPAIQYHFGLWLLDYPENANKLRLRNGESVYITCATGFKDISLANYISDGRIQMVCENDYFYLKLPSGLSRYYGNMQCKGPKWSLYETELSCFVMAGRNLRENNVLGHLCYDMGSMTLKRLHYELQEPKVRRNEENPDLPPIDVRLVAYLEIADFQTGFKLMFNAAANEYVADGSHTNWLKLANYQSQSIVRLGYQAPYFDEYAPLTNISWWPNLLYGNWQRYSEALEKHLPQVPGGYRVYVGTEGSVKSPIKPKCPQSAGQDLLLTEQRHPIPLYVWNYLKANNNSEEIVIIGYNSPFFEFEKKEEAIFCPDICREVAWLKNASDTFGYTTMGVVFCCRPDDVVLSGKLPDFPREPRKLEQLEPASEENTIPGASDLEVTTGVGTVEPPRQDGQPDEEAQNDKALGAVLLGAVLLAMGG